MIGDTIIYKELASYPGYRFGSDGSVWSCRKSGKGFGKSRSEWRLLKPWKATTSNHLYVCLYPRFTNVAVHRLILEAFSGPCPSGLEACHANDIATDNRIDNLRWDTRESNYADRVKNGSDARGDRHGKSKLIASQIKAIREEYKIGAVTQGYLAKKYQTSRENIGRIVRRLSWSHLD